MQPADPWGQAARNPGDARAHVPDFQRHNLDWDLPAAWAALAVAGRRASRASTDALTGLPVLAVVRHLTPLPRYAGQRAHIVNAVKSQDLPWQAQHGERQFSATLIGPRPLSWRSRSSNKSAHGSIGKPVLATRCGLPCRRLRNDPARQTVRAKPPLPLAL
jgi:hypothetical protein